MQYLLNQTSAPGRDHKYAIIAYKDAAGDVVTEPLTSAAQLGRFDKWGLAVTHCPNKDKSLDIVPGEKPIASGAFFRTFCNLLGPNSAIVTFPYNPWPMCMNSGCCFIARNVSEDSVLAHLTQYRYRLLDRLLKRRLVGILAMTKRAAR